MKRQTINFNLKIKLQKMERLAVNERKTAEGLTISNSSVRRLERIVKILKEEYDSRKIKSIFMKGMENDLQKSK